MRPALRRLVLVAAALVAVGVGTGAGVADAGPRRTRVAQPASGATTAKARATDRALAGVRAAEKRRAALAADRAALQRRYQQELAEIDGLKRQKASWRRDRQLRARLAASLETAKQLGGASNELVVLDGELAKLRRALLAAIDAELTAGAPGSRAGSLRTLRGEVAAKVAPRKPPKKIVLPDDELDPNADPDELDDQAAALRASEEELAREIANLDRQATRFRKQAELRKAHQRADELATRDDASPRRTSGTSGGGARGDGPAAPTADPEADDAGGGPEPGDGGGGGFEGDPAVALSDVVDGATVDALRKAERSTDPAAKAAAAEKARDQVARRLRALQQRRKEIEQRARSLRD